MLQKLQILFSNTLVRKKPSRTSGTRHCCTTCGGSFVITPIEKSFLRGQGLPTPKVCRLCGHHNRHTGQQPKSVVGW